MHTIAHSHNDAGWLKSFEGYYDDATSHILTNTIGELETTNGTTFHWADLAFFNRWWGDQNSTKKESVRDLVKQERLIFIGGGWVMNDEALSSYKGVLQNFDAGLRFLKKEFNVRPKIGWQIDPFGQG